MSFCVCCCAYFLWDYFCQCAQTVSNSFLALLDSFRGFHKSGKKKTQNPLASCTAAPLLSSISIEVLLLLIKILKYVQPPSPCTPVLPPSAPPSLLGSATFFRLILKDLLCFLWFLICFPCKKYHIFLSHILNLYIYSWTAL